MDFDIKQIAEFKKVIEDIVDARLKSYGITSFVAAVVTKVNDDGTVNHNGTAILIGEDKNDTDWVKGIEFLVNNQNYLKELQDNLHNDFKVKYELKTVSKDRTDFYKNIVKYSF